MYQLVPLDIPSRLERTVVNEAVAGLDFRTVNANQDGPIFRLSDKAYRHAKELSIVVARQLWAKGHKVKLPADVLLGTNFGLLSTECSMLNIHTDDTDLAATYCLSSFATYNANTYIFPITEVGDTTIDDGVSRVSDFAEIIYSQGMYRAVPKIQGFELAQAPIGCATVMDSTTFHSSALVPPNCLRLSIVFL